MHEQLAFGLCTDRRDKLSVRRMKLERGRYVPIKKLLHGAVEGGAAAAQGPRLPPLGRAAVAVVHRAVLRSNGREVAVKVLSVEADDWVRIKDAFCES